MEELFISIVNRGAVLLFLSPVFLTIWAITKTGNRKAENHRNLNEINKNLNEINKFLKNKK